MEFHKVTARTDCHVERTVVRNVTPPPPCLGTALRKNRPLVPQSNSRTTFFTTVLGFSGFWWMQDSYSGVQDNISRVLLWVPLSGGTLSISHRRTYPLNPSPLLSTPSLKQPAPDKDTTKSQLNTGGH